MHLNTFDRFKDRYDQETDDDEEQPRTDFSRIYGTPRLSLIRIGPGAEESCDESYTSFAYSTLGVLISTTDKLERESSALRYANAS